MTLEKVVKFRHLAFVFLPAGGLLGQFFGQFVPFLLDGLALLLLRLLYERFEEHLGRCPLGFSLGFRHPLQFGGQAGFNLLHEARRHVALGLNLLLRLLMLLGTDRLNRKTVLRRPLGDRLEGEVSVVVEPFHDLSLISDGGNFLHLFGVCGLHPFPDRLDFGGQLTRIERRAFEESLLFGGCGLLSRYLIHSWDRTLVLRGLSAKLLRLLAAIRFDGGRLLGDVIFIHKILLGSNCV